MRNLKLAHILILVVAYVLTRAFATTFETKTYPPLFHITL